MKDSDNLPINLTDYTAYAHVRERYNTDIVLDLSPTVSTPLSGEVSISVADTITDAISANAGAYTYDLMLVNGSGEKLGPYLQGEVTIFESITQP